MAFVPVPNVLMAELVFVSNYQYCENTLYARTALDPQDSDPEQVALALYSWWNTNCKPYQSSSTSLNRIDVTDISNPAGFFYSYTPPANNGTLVSPILPGNVTLAVKFNTNRSGRSYRGRNYWIGLTEGDVVGDVVATTLIDHIVTAYQQLIDDLGTAGYSWVVVSRYTNNAPRAEGISTQIETVTVNPNIDSQRRRLSGRGR